VRKPQARIAPAGERRNCGLVPVQGERAGPEAGLVSADAPAAEFDIAPEGGRGVPGR
jgi:hypothetical protein